MRSFMYQITHRRGPAARVAMSVVTLLALALGGMTWHEPARRASRGGLRVEAVFSPGGGCESRIVEAIAEAEKSIRVQMYIFTSKPIAQALRTARKRGVEVQVILDKSQEKMTYGQWPTLRRDGVRVYFDRDHEVMNSKVLIVDDRLVITGSYNFTKAAEEKNAENIVILSGDAELAGRFAENFERHLSHARPAS